MGLRAYCLGDTSALARVGRAEVAERLAPLVEAGLVACCTPTDLEAGYFSSGPKDDARMRAARAAWPPAVMDQAVLDRAVEV